MNTELIELSENERLLIVMGLASMQPILNMAAQVSFLDGAVPPELRRWNDELAALTKKINDLTSDDAFIRFQKMLGSRL